MYRLVTQKSTLLLKKRAGVTEMKIELTKSKENATDKKQGNENILYFCDNFDRRCMVCRY